MLAKTHRFHGYNSLKAVHARGQVVRGSSISLKYSQRGTGRAYRVAVVVSRKVSKSAVTRNRIRRRIYEQVRLNADAIQPGSDLVFMVYDQSVANMEASQLQDQTKNLLARASK